MNMPDLQNSQLIILVALSSALILIAAWGFQLIGGYSPCPLCLMQRYAYYFAVPAAIAAIFLLSMNHDNIANFISVLIGLGFVINAGLGIYHAGVEWHWWQGPSSCASSGADFASEASEILKKLQTSKVIRCDEAQWRMFGLSFAGYNVIFSLILTALCFRAITVRRQNPI